MKFQTLSERENPYMERKEFVLILEHFAGATPSNASLQQLLAAEWKAKPEQVDIKQIATSAGKQTSRVKVYVWQAAKVQDLSKPKEEKKEGEVATAEKKE